ncbi:hypothetical protein GCM10027287_21670 [Bordetella muralis]
MKNGRLRLGARFVLDVAIVFGAPDYAGLWFCELTGQRRRVLSVVLMHVVKFAYVLHDFLWVVFDDE